MPAAVTATTTTARTRRMNWYWAESIIDEFDFFAATIAKGHNV
jgi:hypothetical protein